MDAEKILADKRLPITSNRIRILECLMQDDLHFHTISEIAEHLKNVNVKSIYNNIKLLIEAGIVDSYSFGGISKYAINDNLGEKAQKEIHLVDKANDIKHISVENKVFEDIKNEVTKQGHEVVSIKIFVNVK